MKRVLLMTVLGLFVASSAMADMTNCRFALHRKAKFSSTKTITSLCDVASTITVEPNYSPNWNSLTLTSNPLPCTGYTTSGAILTANTVYIVIGRAGLEGVAGASFGFDYSGRDPDGVPVTGDETGISPTLMQFTACSDGLSFPNDGGFGDFPKPKGGIRITWNNATSCQTQVIGAAGVHAVVGSVYVYAYSADQLSITTNNNLQVPPELAVANCAGETTDLAQIWPPAILAQVMGRLDMGGGSGYNPCLVTPVDRETTWGKIKSQYKN